MDGLFQEACLARTGRADQVEGKDVPGLEKAPVPFCKEVVLRKDILFHLDLLPMGMVMMRMMMLVGMPLGMMMVVMVMRVCVHPVIMTVVVIMGMRMAMGMVMRMLLPVMAVFMGVQMGMLMVVVVGMILARFPDGHVSVAASAGITHNEIYLGEQRSRY